MPDTAQLEDSETLREQLAPLLQAKVGAGQEEASQESAVAWACWGVVESFQCHDVHDAICLDQCVKSGRSCVWRFLLTSLHI